jgi:hypothetical protein
MRKILFLLAIAFLTFFLFQDSQNATSAKKLERQNAEIKNVTDYEDGIRLAQEQEFEMTKDVTLGYIPKYRLITAWQDLMQQRQNGQARIETLSWAERGSYTDAVGPSNGNGRPGSPTPVTSGRMRAIIVDSLDATHKTVWAAGIDGGLWKTTDITASPATWTLINDFFGNLAIGAICQDPTTQTTMYFGTGEKTFNADAVRGGGVWKSTNHGVTWSLLANTTGFYNVSKIVVDNSHNIYVGTIGSGSGLQRSTDGGTTWTAITPTINAGGGGTINTSRVADMVYDPVNNKLHVFMGYLPVAGTHEGYCYTTIPSTVTSATWTAATTPFPVSTSSIDNCALACNGSTIYATPANTSDLVTQVYKSIDGGDKWSATGGTPSNSGNNAYTNGQGWYCLALGVDPADANKVIVGSLNCWRTLNGGTTWSQISAWVTGLAVSVYIHADQHAVAWIGSQVLVGSDGGIFYSNDGVSTFSDRNVNLRLKQFYSCAIHPSTTNYFLAGAQDNGVHQFSGAGLTSSVEVTGGDGAFVHIDQTSPLFQFGSYVYNQYRRSTNGGASWSFVDFSSSDGQFINPTDYDNTNAKMYCGYISGNYLRWDDPQSGSSFIAVPIAAFGSGSVTHVKVSPYTSNRVFFGTSGGKIIQVDNANGGTPTSTDITAGGMSASTVSCIAVGTNDNNLIATFSNYGAVHVWVTTTSGISWTNISGTGGTAIPDIPVRWAMFYPSDNTKAILATEMGVYETTLINGASTVWTQNSSFPVVRTDMFKYRSSDRLVAAATHGRGLWTSNFPAPVPVTLVDFQGHLDNTVINLDWATGSEQNSKYFDIQKSSDGTNFFSIGSKDATGNSSTQRNYNFTDGKVSEFNYYRLKMVDIDGRFSYSRTILIKNPNAAQNVWVVNNPFETSIKLRLAKTPKQKVQFSLLNILGTQIWQNEYASSNEFTLDFSWIYLPSGAYLLRTNVDGQIFTNKIIKK